MAMLQRNPWIIISVDTLPNGNELRQEKRIIDCEHRYISGFQFIPHFNAVARVREIRFRFEHRYIEIAPEWYGFELMHSAFGQIPRSCKDRQLYTFGDWQFDDYEFQSAL